jgi:hypothetical protein
MYLCDIDVHTQAYRARTKLIIGFAIGSNWDITGFELIGLTHCEPAYLRGLAQVILNDEYDMSFQKSTATDRTTTQHELYYRVDSLAAVKQRSDVTISASYYR